MNSFLSLFRNLLPQRYLLDRVSVRVPIYTLSDVSLQLTAPTTGDFRLANISSGGFAISTADKTPHTFARGENLEGNLTFGGKKFKFAGQVRHCFGYLVGVQFKDPNPALIETIHSFFAAEIEGLLLQKKEEAGTKTGEQTVVFESKTAELRLQLEHGNLKHFQLYFSGHYLDGGKDSPKRYGVLHSKDQALIKDAVLTNRVPKEVVSLIRKFVFSIRDLPGQWAEQIDFWLWLD